MAKFSQEANLILQSACASVLMFELNRDNRLLESDFFNDLEFLTPEVKDIIVNQIGIGNQGTFLMVIYALLVVPKELLQNQYASEFNGIDAYIAKIVKTSQTNYKSDVPTIRYINHMRNAIAHAKIKILEEPERSVIFSDDSPRNEHCEFELPQSELIPLMNKLLKIHGKYIKTLPR